MRTLEDRKGFRIEPVDTLNTTRIVENGHGGNKPLPVVDMPNNFILVPWLPSRKALKAMLAKPHVIQLVVGPDGSMSMSVVPVGLTKEN